MARRLCARSILPAGSRVDIDEEFCPNPPTVDVVVTFNGLRYLVDLCDQHKAEHDDAAARRRQARKDANAKAKRNHESRYAKAV